jgi:hypothetical protein
MGAKSRSRTDMPDMVVIMVHQADSQEPPASVPVIVQDSTGAAEEKRLPADSNGVIERGEILTSQRERGRELEAGWRRARCTVGWPPNETDRIHPTVSAW